MSVIGTDLCPSCDSVHGLLWSTSRAPHIDGIYYDGINFDRRSMQRVRKVSKV